MVLAAEDAEQGFGFDSAGVGEAVLTVGGEDEVLGARCASHADLSGLLAEHRRPQAQLTLALQCCALRIDAADEDHVPVEPAQILVGELCGEGVVLARGDTVAVLGEHLNHPRLRGLTVGSPGSY